jgi:fumarate hydratase class II
MTTMLPKVLDHPIGLHAHGMWREFDSLGDLEVRPDHYWGAQTHRSLQHFHIGDDWMRKEMYHAYFFLERSSAVVNAAAGGLRDWEGQLIEQVCDEVMSGSWMTAAAS